MATKPRVVQVRHAADVHSHTHAKRMPSMGQILSQVWKYKIISVRVVGPGTEKIPMTEINTDQPIERHEPKGEVGAGIGDMHQRTQRTEVNIPPDSAHSIERNSFQDHPELHGRHPLQSNDFVKKTFHIISRSKSVASISNEMDPDGKTKILTILNIKLPHWNGIENIRAKVDDSAEANILSLDSFKTMFPHALDEQGYPKDGFLRRSRTALDCYDDGKLINHGSIKLRLQHYSDKSF